MGHADSSVCARASAGGYKKQQLAAAKSKTSEIVHKLMIQSPACRFGRQITGTVGDLHCPCNRVWKVMLFDIISHVAVLRRKEES